jgi:hypothetical protein
MHDDRQTRARFAIADYTDRGADMSAEEFRRCVAIVLAYSDDEATTLVNHASSEQLAALPGELIPHGCGPLRMVRIVEESRIELKPNPRA